MSNSVLARPNSVALKAAEKVASSQLRFYVTPALAPKSRLDRNRRVHYFVSKIGISISALLRDRLLAIRKLADRIKDPTLAALASKEFSEAEFLPAVKELLCIWIHLNALEQGADLMPAWLMSYLKLSLYASDYLIATPEAMSVMDLHSDCSDLDSLCSEVALKVCQYLGFAEAAAAFAPAIKPLLTESRYLIEKHLKDSLVKSLDELAEDLQ